MRYHLKYVVNRGNISIWGSQKNKEILFDGDGTVFFQDTALVFKGNIPKFELWFLDRIFQKVLYIKTSRTVPYSTIIKHKKPGINKIHSITYKLPDGSNASVRFKMKSPVRKNNQGFINKLNDYLSASDSLNR